MQMRPALDDLLCRRYPALYADRHGDVRRTAMGWGFQIGDGWFGLIDALSEVLSSNDGCPRPKARQVKQKCGSLRFYAGLSERDCGAIALVEEMSRRICEASGLPVRLCQAGNEDPAPLVPGVGLGQTIGRIDIPPLGFSLKEMIRWRADVLDGPVDVPDGWYDLVDAVLHRMQWAIRGARADYKPPRVQRMWLDENALQFDWIGGGPAIYGLSIMAAAVSRRIDRVSGAIGPVDNQGQVIAHTKVDRSQG